MSNAQSAPHTAGSDFKARRLALGLTRKQLAAASNTGVQTIARFELYGSTPHHTTPATGRRIGASTRVSPMQCCASSIRVMSCGFTTTT